MKIFTYIYRLFSMFFKKFFFIKKLLIDNKFNRIIYKLKHVKCKHNKKINSSNVDVYFFDAIRALGDFTIYLHIIKNLETNNLLVNKFFVFSIKYKEIIQKLFPCLKNNTLFIEDDSFNLTNFLKISQKFNGIKEIKKYIKIVKKSIGKNWVFRNIYYFCPHYDLSFLIFIKQIQYKKIFCVPYSAFFDSPNCQNQPLFIQFDRLSEKNKKWILNLPFSSITWEKKDLHLINIASSLFKINFTTYNFSSFFNDYDKNETILINLPTSTSVKNLTVQFLVNFLEKIKLKFKENFNIIIISRINISLQKSIEESFAKIHFINKEINLLDLFNLVNKCKIVFSSDTGIAHISTLLGVKTICICSFLHYYYGVENINKKWYMCYFLNYNLDYFNLIFTYGVFETSIKEICDSFNFRKIVFSKNSKEVGLNELMDYLIEFI